MSSSRSRVFITGVGAVTTFGPGAIPFWEGCKAGVTQYSRIPDEWRKVSQFGSDVYSPLAEIDYTNHGIGRVEQLYYDPSVLNLFVACNEALENANIETITRCEKNNTYTLEGLNQYATGVFIGSGNGGINSLLENYRHFLLNKLMAENPQTFPDDLRDTLIIPKRFNKFVTAREMPNAVSAGVAIKYGIKGPVKSAHYACSSSTVAIGEAFEAVQSGKIELAIVGGTEFATDHLGSTFRSFDVAHALGSLVEGEWKGPFDSGSNGFLFSEGGAGALIIESEQSMQRRNVASIAELVGYETTFDAFNIMAPEDSGAELERLIINLCDGASVDIRDIGYVNAHGTGTKNDASEARLIDNLMPQNPLCNSTKSIIGHTLGASGALETIITALSLRDQTVHASGSVTEPLQGINLANQTQKAEITFGMKISSAFGGHNAGLLLKKAE